MNLIPVGFNIYQSNISDEFYNFLIRELENIDSYKELHQNENFWGGSDYTFVKEETRTYIETNLLNHIEQYINTRSMKLRNQWVNCQAHDGFLPIHKHSGDLSYVIYLKIPEYLKNYENKRPNDLRYSEGCIQFIYGHQTSISSPNTIILPSEKMILIFPSEVSHYVYPFKDKETLRVSVSGNLDFVR